MLYPQTTYSHYYNGAYHCPECGKGCDTAYVWRDSGELVECDNRVAAHYTDDEGHEDFVCPNGCELDAEHSHEIYTWKGSGEPVGCWHCIQEVDISELE